MNVKVDRLTPDHAHDRGEDAGRLAVWMFGVAFDLGVQGAALALPAQGSGRRPLSRISRSSRSEEQKQMDVEIDPDDIFDLLEEERSSMYTDQELDDLIDLWHDGAGKDQSLAQFLGWTDAEYATWVETCRQPNQLTTPRSSSQDPE